MSYRLKEASDSSIVFEQSFNLNFFIIFAMLGGAAVFLTGLVLLGRAIYISENSLLQAEDSFSIQVLSLGILFFSSSRLLWLQKSQLHQSARLRKDQNCLEIYLSKSNLWEKVISYRDIIGFSSSYRGKARHVVSLIRKNGALFDLASFARRGLAEKCVQTLEQFWKKIPNRLKKGVPPNSELSEQVRLEKMNQEYRYIFPNELYGRATIGIAGFFTGLSGMICSALFYTRIELQILLFLATFFFFFVLYLLYISYTANQFENVIATDLKGVFWFRAKKQEVSNRLFPAKISRKDWKDIQQFRYFFDCYRGVQFLLIDKNRTTKADYPTLLTRRNHLPLPTLSIIDSLILEKQLMNRKI